MREDRGEMVGYGRVQNMVLSLSVCCSAEAYTSAVSQHRYFRCVSSTRHHSRTFPKEWTSNRVAFSERIHGNENGKEREEKGREGRSEAMKQNGRKIYGPPNRYSKLIS